MGGIKIIPISINERGCWLWMGMHNGLGYAQIKKGKGSPRVLMSRIILSAKLGRPIKPKHKSCHTCDTPPCINPEHLFEGTQKQNLQDMARKGRHWNTKKTHCKHGHEFTEENTYINPGNGTRHCRICLKQMQTPQKAERELGV